MIFKQLNPGACRSYLVGSERTKEVVLIDPVLDGVDRYLRLLQSDGMKLRWVIDTHTHADHISGAALLQQKAQVHYLMHLNSNVKCVSKKLRERDALGLGELTMSFLHVPGHTQDSLLVLLPDRFLSGDFLFIGEDGAGRLDLPGGSAAAHHQSLRKLDTLADGTLMFPAHDYRGREHARLGEQRRSNPLLQPRTRDEYLKYWEELKLGPAEWMKQVLEANHACATEPSAASIPAESASGACAPCAAAAPVHGASRAPALTPVQLRERAAKDQARLFILDVREPDEYTGDLGHIPGSVLIPLGQLEDRFGEVPKDKTIVAVCKSGRRSARAAELLMAKGFRDAYTMTGGMQAWDDEELPVER
ncbi:MAG: MBL fold metallo-hydrolase [Elusimicrobia bacterium]|nr:MBL fold metallo-hydrolase [Elusimicrobiota bacterium]